MKCKRRALDLNEKLENTRAANEHMKTKVKQPWLAQKTDIGDLFSIEIGHNRVRQMEIRASANKFHRISPTFA